MSRNGKRAPAGYAAMLKLREQIAAEVAARRAAIAPADDEQSFKLLNPRRGKPKKITPFKRVRRRSKYA